MPGVDLTLSGGSGKVNIPAVPEFSPITYGDGSMGAAALDGVTTYSFATLTGGNLYALNRDTFLTNLTINPGITLDTNGFRLLWAGTLLNNGVIHNDGNPAVNGTAGAATSTGTLGIGTAGGNGRSNNTGLAGSGQSQGLQDSSAVGGAGGAGGANAGGAGGTYTSLQSNGGANYLPSLLTGFLFGQTSGGNQAQITVIGGGAGGGGGGSDGAAAGGGGGSGGGPMVLAGYNTVNNGTIRSAGGNGANASGAGGNAGGGGGGAGGIIQLVFRYFTGNAPIVPGGAGGSGIGTGVAGASGSPGHVNTGRA